MVAAGQSPWLVVGAQPGQVVAETLGCHLADVEIAAMLNPESKIVLVTSERAGAEALGGFVLEKAHGRLG